MYCILLLISASLSSATREVVKVDGKSRITEVRSFDEHGNQEVEWTKTETRLDLFTDYATGDEERFLLRQELWLRWNDHSEGTTSKLTLSRWNRGKRGYDRLAWKKSVAGQDVSFFEGMLQATTYGCCAEPNTYRYIVPASGKLLATLTARPLPLHGKQSGLFLGYHPNRSEPYLRSDTTNRGGTLTLFSSDSMVSELVVVPREKNDASPELFELGDKIRLVYERSDTLHVQVGEDRKLWRIESRHPQQQP